MNCFSLAFPTDGEQCREKDRIVCYTHEEAESQVESAVNVSKYNPAHTTTERGLNCQA